MNEGIQHMEDSALASFCCKNRHILGHIVESARQRTAFSAQSQLKWKSQPGAQHREMSRAEFREE